MAASAALLTAMCPRNHGSTNDALTIPLAVFVGSLETAVELPLRWRALLRDRQQSPTLLAIAQESALRPQIHEPRISPGSLSQNSCADPNVARRGLSIRGRDNFHVVTLMDTGRRACRVGARGWYWNPDKVVLASNT
jgi:hypothetical protein